ncbi:MAG: LysR substrate-binding domain-containing protein [Variovorax sp.]
MNLRQIEVFRAIMTTGSVSDAARLLHVSVPAVSRVLSLTESRLQFPLFERIKGRLHPTTEARTLFHEVELVYRGVQRIGELTHELADRRQAILNLVASPSIGQMIIPEAIANFRSGNPDVRVNFHSLNHKNLTERLLNRQADLGISILPVDHPNLHTSPIARSRIVCICACKHPLASKASVEPADLRGEALVSYPLDTPFGSRVERLFADHDEALKVAIEVSSPQNACAMIVAGGGVALIDEFSLHAWPTATFAVLPFSGDPLIIADLAYPRTEPLSQPAEAFVRSLRSVLLQHGLALSERAD